MTDSPATRKLLVIDTASRRVCVGLFDEMGSLTTRNSDEEASLSLFPLVKNLLEPIDWSLADLDSIAFCSGPGSVLGIRTAAMGIRTWQGAGLLPETRIYSYSSLHLGATLVRLSQSEYNEPFITLTDARRQSWNALKSDRGRNNPIAILENEALEAATAPLFSFNEFPVWTQTSADIAFLPYRPECVMESPEFAPLLEENATADPMKIRPMEFAKWTAKPRTADQIDP